jgi:8-hydroxy-5-deazaflavin:NADPH oxidoreductase
MPKRHRRRGGRVALALGSGSVWVNDWARLNDQSKPTGQEEDHMPTAIIGIGNIGKRVAVNLSKGGEAVILTASALPEAEQLAWELGPPASAAGVPDAIDRADAVIFAVWFDRMKELIGAYGSHLAGKVVIDPSNPIGPDGNGGFTRTLPDGVSAGSVIAGLLPPGAHYVKAFGTVAAEKLADAANRSPDRAVLFYATDDATAASTAERLISAAGFDPFPVGGLDEAIRIEAFGDLHDMGGLNGRLLSLAQARALLRADADAQPR